MGFIVGLTPFWTLQNLLILMIVILTKVNLNAAFFSIFLFSFVAYLFDPLFHNLGYFLLAQVEALNGLWTALYNMPIAPFTRFYNTIVAGSLLTALIMAFPVYFLGKSGIVWYRKTLGPKVENSKFVKAVRGTGLYKWYAKIRDMEWIS